MPRNVFINLPVRDLAAATRIYEAIGCSRNPQFSDDRASSMVWSETVTFQLLAADYFATFTPKPVGNARENSQMLIALGAESREAVDGLVEAAASAGGTADPRAVQDHGWLYNRTFEDADGNVFEVLWLNADEVPPS